MNFIKQARQDFGYTQLELVERSGLSLRTIQRSEADEHAPKGHSLKMLAKAFDLTPAELQEKFVVAADAGDTDAYAIRIINLSVLAFFLFPFGNVFLPLYMWRKYRGSKLVDEVGRRIVNFQIFWTVVLISSLILAPFINVLGLSSHPLILYVLFICLAINVGVVFATARAIQRKEMDFPRSPVALF